MQDSLSITTDQRAAASDMSGTNRIGGRNLRRRESVELLGVASEDLVLELGSQILDHPLCRADAIRPGRVRVRIVRLAHHVVLADLAQAGHTVVVFDEAAI